MTSRCLKAFVKQHQNNRRVTKQLIRPLYLAFVCQHGRRYFGNQSVSFDATQQLDTINSSINGNIDNANDNDNDVNDKANFSGNVKQDVDGTTENTTSGTLDSTDPTASSTTTPSTASTVPITAQQPPIPRQPPQRPNRSRQRQQTQQANRHTHRRDIRSSRYDNSPKGMVFKENTVEGNIVHALSMSKPVNIELAKRYCADASANPALVNNVLYHFGEKLNMSVYTALLNNYDLKKLDADTMSALIVHFSKHKRLRPVQNLWKFVRAVGRELSEQAYYQLLILFSTIDKVHQVTKLKRVVEHMERVGITPTPLLYRALITTFGKHDCPSEVKLYFNAMKQREMQPNHACYMAMLHVLSTAEEKERVYKEMAENIGVDHRVYTVMLRAYAKENKTQDMLRFFNKIPDPDHYHFDTLLKHFGTKSDIVNVMDTYNKMSSSSALNVSTIITLLEAFGKQRDKTNVRMVNEIRKEYKITVSEDYFKALLKATNYHTPDPELIRETVDDLVVNNIKIDHDIFREIINGYARLHRWRDCVSVYEKMLQTYKTLRIDNVAVCKLIEAYSYLGKMTESERVVKSVAATQGFKPTLLYYAHLIFGYIRCGDTSGALGTYSRMRHERLVPPLYIIDALLKEIVKLPTFHEPASQLLDMIQVPFGSPPPQKPEAFALHMQNEETHRQQAGLDKQRDQEGEGKEEGKEEGDLGKLEKQEIVGEEQGEGQQEGAVQTTSTSTSVNSTQVLEHFPLDSDAHPGQPNLRLKEVPMIGQASLSPPELKDWTGTGEYAMLQETSEKDLKEFDFFLKQVKNLLDVGII